MAVALLPAPASAEILVLTSGRALTVDSAHVDGESMLMPALVRQYGLDDPFNPTHNLAAGMKHLRRLLQRFDIRSGPGCLQRR
jgi:hypothetical protein